MCVKCSVHLRLDDLSIISKTSHMLLVQVRYDLQYNRKITNSFWNLFLIIRQKSFTIVHYGRSQLNLPPTCTPYDAKGSTAFAESYSSVGPRGPIKKGAVKLWEMPPPPKFIRYTWLKTIMWKITTCTRASNLIKQDDTILRRCLSSHRSQGNLYTPIGLFWA